MATNQEVIELKGLRFEHFEFPILGVTELIIHKWSEKAKREMLESQMGKVKEKKRAPKDPKADYEGCFYYLDDGSYGFPAVGFKAAIVTAARQYETVSMAALKAAIFVNGETMPDGTISDFVRIIGNPYMREDMVRVGMGTADLRYRPGFKKWKATLSVEYNAGLISREVLANLVNASGYGGIGEWRPSAPKSYTGSYGRYRIANVEEWEAFDIDEPLGR